MKFIIDTDLTNEGTSISIDGKRLNDERKIASISFMADAPNKKYEEDGYMSLSIVSFDDDGNVKRENFGRNTSMSENIKPLGLSDDISFNKDDVIRFLGDEIDAEKVRLVDSILQLSAEKKMACPDKNTLLNRSIDSLRDKAFDLGFTSDET